jgi:ACS family hexuronate transporter-like MFS transporter
MILGFGEAGNWPGATKSNAEWFPVSERATAQGIFNSGSAVGAIISAPIIVLIFLAFSWRLSFIILGISGLLWLIPWLIINKGLPSEHPWITNEEKKIISCNDKATKGNDEPVPGILKILASRQCWSIILARFFIDPVWWSFLI